MIFSKNYCRDLHKTILLDQVLSSPQHYVWHIKMIIKGNHLWSGRTVLSVAAIVDQEVHVWHPHLMRVPILGYS